MIYYEKIRWASLTLHKTMQPDHQVFVPGQEVDRSVIVVKSCSESLSWHDNF